ncbi:hypothetical protein FACS189472_02050 [Alphaproteobacteria bacterium]|nr:hypothetical protein FACS189472_02050 [Alphaproteobacteria bacterium]
MHMNDNPSEFNDKTLTAEEYYFIAFKILEDHGKHTWNWAAFFFGSMWLFYRKMPLLGTLYAIFELVYSFHLENLYDTASLTTKVIALILAFLPGILIGAFGNAIYYDRVKKNIKKGYHMCKKYSPTSILSIFVLPAPFAWIRDRILLHDAMKKCNSSFNDELSKKNIRAATSKIDWRQQ